MVPFALEHFDEQAADDLALFFGVGNAFQRPQELLTGIHVDDVQVHVLGEGVHYLRGLVQPQQAVVDEHAGELLADGLVDQRCGYGRIDPSAQAQNDLFLPYGLPDPGHGFRNIFGHLPVAAAAADVLHEAVQELRPLAGVRHLGVELHAVEAPLLVGHAGDRAGVGGGHQLEAGGHLRHLVAVAHPHL